MKFAVLFIAVLSIAYFIVEPMVDHVASSMIESAMRIEQVRKDR